MPSKISYTKRTFILLFSFFFFNYKLHTHHYQRVLNHQYWLISKIKFPKMNTQIDYHFSNKTTKLYIVMKHCNHNSQAKL